MEIGVVKEQLLEMPGSVEDYPFGPDVAVFKVGGKMFALINASGDSINLKNDPVENEWLRLEYPGITPGYHMNKRHWNTVNIKTVEETLIKELIRRSYRIVLDSLTKKQREAVDHGQDR